MAAANLKAYVADRSDHRDEILAAIDMRFTGIW